MIDSIKQDLKSISDPNKAKILAKFFKTGPGEYGEGDIFIGISVPNQRKVAKKYQDIHMPQLEKLLQSSIHEHRLTALIILISKFKKLPDNEKRKIINFYLKNTKFINNWDLVDLSAPKILGQYVLENPSEKKLLYKLANSKNLWEKRIAMISCFTLIRDFQFEDALKIAEILLFNDHDLIHKAVGWMLREIGKKDQKVEEKFLQKYYKKMPRTTLRYSIEKFNEKKRKFYLNS